MPHVRMLAFTVFNDQLVDDYMVWTDEHNEGRNSPDMLAEFAGRLCYRSFGRQNSKTRRTVDYIANILRQQHYSVLEHSSVTFLLDDVSRSLTHELVRHRHLSYSQVSQRYVDESVATAVMPPVLRNATGEDAHAIQRNVHAVQAVAQDVYQRVYNFAIERGATRKEARGAARSVLPNATNTTIVVTGNLRAWREFLAKRWHVAADDEIREVAGMIRHQLVNYAPATFQDVPAKPYGS